MLRKFLYFFVILFFVILSLSFWLYIGYCQKNEPIGAGTVLMKLENKTFVGWTGKYRGVSRDGYYEDTYETYRAEAPAISQYRGIAIGRAWPISGLSL